MSSEKDTIPNNEAILNAIGELSGKIAALEPNLNIRIDGLRNEIKTKFDAVDAKFEDMRLQMMSFDVRIDRIEALTHEVLNVSYNARADVKDLREEVHAWSREIGNLQLRLA